MSLGLRLWDCGVVLPGPQSVILDVDTHTDVHVAAVITVLGVPLANAEFATTAVGYRQLLAWARGFGVLHRAGVEGTGSFGAALTRHLRRHDITVVEVNRPDRAPAVGVSCSRSVSASCASGS